MIPLCRGWLFAACALALSINAAAQENLVTLHVENEEISSVLRMLSETHRVSIIAGPEVTGLVSLNLYQVPFEQALDAMLGVSGFTHYRVGNIIYVTSEARKAELPMGAHDLEMRTITLNHLTPEEVVPVVTEFLSAAGKALPGGRKTIVVQDNAAHVQQVVQLLEQLDKPASQVSITVHIINVKRDDNMEIGVGFDTFPFTRYGVEALGQGFAEEFPPRPDPFGVVDLNDLPGGTGLFAGTLQSDSRVFVEALDEVSDVEILAAPKLLVMDGTEARIQVGDRLGFRITTTTETASLESVEFLEVGTVLQVTPNISTDGLIDMQINPKVSNGAIDNEGLPTENTSEVQTNLIVADGETIIIGGLLNATRQKSKRQIPFLGDIPLLGKLFGRTSWVDNESELVVLLTPQIIGPTPSPLMAEKAQAAKARWEPLLEQGGVATPATPPIEESPSKQWRDFIRGRKGIVPNPPPPGTEDAAEAAAGDAP